MPVPVKKAVGLLSGGLDSTLAAQILIEQGVEVYAINFVTPFCTCTPGSSGCSAVAKAVEQLGNIPLKRVALGDEYLEMIRSPRHGYGRGMNPCIDCRILKIKKAADYMREIGASFLFTGEVLGQRPMSQHRRAIAVIDADSGMKGYVLRPLSAALFEPTIPEMEGIVDRSRLLALEGRTRKPQIALAQEKNITDYPCPAGGCRLTDVQFGKRLSDYFDRITPLSIKDAPFLRFGRYSTIGNGAMTFVSRNEEEGKKMLATAPTWVNLFIPRTFSGPVIASQSPWGGEIAVFMRRYGKLSASSENLVECREGGLITERRLDEVEE